MMIAIMATLCKIMGGIEMNRSITGYGNTDIIIVVLSYESKYTNLLLSLNEKELSFTFLLVMK